MKRSVCKGLSWLLTVVMLLGLCPVFSVTAAEGAVTPIMAYVPLDNRPVVYQRVQMAAGAAGFDIRVPEEDMIRTLLDGQGGNNPQYGCQHGDGEAIMDWLEEMEESGCDNYIIHLDMMFSGGLVGSRHPDSETVTDADLALADRLTALASDPNNTVYFIDIVMRLASTGSYKGYDSNEYSALRSWGSVERYAMNADFATADYTESLLLIGDIADYYHTAPDGSTIDYTAYDEHGVLNDSNVAQYLAFRTRKLTLQNLMLQKLAETKAVYLCGIDDSSPNFNIQGNEMVFLDARARALGYDEHRYLRLSDTDSVGLMAVARLVNDRYKVRPRMQTIYFGNKADATDDYGVDTLRKTMTDHIHCLNADEVTSNPEMEVLVLTQPDSSYKDASYEAAVNNLVARAESNVANNIPTIIVDASDVFATSFGAGYANLQDALINSGIDLGKIFGYSNWNTVGNAIGIALGIGVSRYSYIKHSANIVESSHEWHMKSIGYAYVKDIAYNARNKLNYWSTGATNQFGYWLDKTMGWGANNHYPNIDAYDGATDGNIEEGEAYINTVLEAFMRGTASEYVSGYKNFNGNATQLAALLETCSIYANLNHTVQTMDIDGIELSGFRFPWNRKFEMWVDVTPTVGAKHTYYLKDNTLLRQVPVMQTATQLIAHAKEQYSVSSVVVRNLAGAVLASSDVVGTGFTVTMSGTAYYAVVTGDTDGDAEVSTTDVRQTMKKVLQVQEFSAAQTAAADLDGNGKIASTDARRMLQHILTI